MRPSPQNTASSPVVPASGVRAPMAGGARPPMGMARGGMPMPMGMRGPAGMGGGGGQMQSRLPPSLQAKMDKVRFMVFVSSLILLVFHLVTSHIERGHETLS